MKSICSFFLVYGHVCSFVFVEDSTLAGLQLLDDDPGI